METDSETRSRILIVDDEAATAASVSFVLKHSGHTVDVVTDGEEAFSRITQHPNRYRVVITDHAMMKVSGLELAERLRKINFEGRIVVLTAYLSWNLERSYRDAWRGQVYFQVV